VKKIIPAVVFLIAMAGASDLGAQKLYTWTDDQGVAHITDNPPPQNAKVENITVYPARTPQEIDAVERQKQQLREKNKQFEESEAARLATIESQKAQERAREAMQKVQEQTQYNQEYIRRLSSTKDKRKQFRKKIERIKNETETAQAEAKAAEQEAEAAAQKAQQAAGEAGNAQ
jgi:septal ring factor EnvC (AmiA/AmiB activator)